jgi:GNAT superfamily N-acetyltransferase
MPAPPSSGASPPAQPARPGGAAQAGEPADRVERPHIRAAVAADAVAIHTMLLAIAATTGEADKIAGTPHDLARHGFGAAPAFRALIAEAAGRPVGLCLFFTTFSSWRGRLGLYVQDLYVDPSVRGGGLGRRLLAAAAAEGARHGATHLRLSVDAGNAAAEAFYRRVGFEAAGHERIQVLDGAAFAALADGGNADAG